MSNILVRLESIYREALGKIFIDSGDISLVSANDNLRTTLEIESNDQPHDVHIADLEKRAGIFIRGKIEGVERILEVLKSNLPDIIIFTHPVQQDAIYVAKVSRYIFKKRIAIVDLGSEQQGIIFNINCNVGDKILVQIKELSTEARKLPVCSTIITLSGKYCILEEGSNFVRVSRKIKGDDRRKLHELGKKIAPKDFGLIIRTSALSILEEDLEKEIEELKIRWKKIIENANEAIFAGKLSSGEMVVEILIGYSSKNTLNTVRAGLLPTIPMYYQLKAYSSSCSFSLDFLQSIIDNISGIELKEMKQKLSDLIYKKDYLMNNHIKAEFYYPDGTFEEKVLGDLVIANEELLKTRRKIESNAEYKFPNFIISKGDIIEVLISPGSWTIHYKYYKKDTEDIIGERVRIISPIDLAFRGRVRAFDMGINLYHSSEESSTIIPQIKKNSRSNLVENGLISKELDIKLGEILIQATEALESSNDEILIKLE